MFKNRHKRFRKKRINTFTCSKSKDKKHNYEKIIIETPNGFNWGKICKNCGNLQEDFSDFYSYKSANKDFLKEKKSENGFSYLEKLSIGEIHKKFPDFKIYIYHRKIEEGYTCYGVHFKNSIIDFNKPRVKIKFKPKQANI